MEMNENFTYSPSGLGMEFTACCLSELREYWHHLPYVADIGWYRYFANQALFITSERRSCTIFYQWIYTLIWQRNLISLSGINTIGFSDNFVVVYFFGPPCMYCRELKSAVANLVMRIDSCKRLLME